MKSLRVRFLLVGAFILFAFVLLTAISLERAFRETAINAQEERLKGLVYAVLGATDVDEKGVVSVALEEVPEPRLQQPDSGMGAMFFDGAGDVAWSSIASPISNEVRVQLAVGEWSYAVDTKTHNGEGFRIAFGLNWVVGDSANFPFTLVILEDESAYNALVGTYRRTLWGWLGLSALALLLVQFVVLTWGLAPLRQMVSEIDEIQTGEKSEMDRSYPRELRPLTAGFNRLLRHERNQQARYRNALGDLAHSLKTPLAVLKGFSEKKASDPDCKEELAKEVGRMNRIVEYQLQKASVAGPKAFTDRVFPREIAEQIGQALVKVYPDKNVAFNADLLADEAVRIDEGDLMEIFGNLLDNAWKACKGRVTIWGRKQHGTLRIRVDDDGSGFPKELSEEILMRGVRADSRYEGQGIGLAVVGDLVGAYSGQLKLETSPLGGARVDITLRYS